MKELQELVQTIEGAEDYEKRLDAVINNFAIDNGLREKTVWKYYDQLRKAGRVK